MFAQDLRALARLCKEIKDEDGEKYGRHANKVAGRIIQLMYDEEKKNLKSNSLLALK